MPVVTVTHRLGSYPVIVESGGLGRLPELLARHLPGRRLAAITDETVAGHLAAWLPETARGWELLLTVEAGEQAKSRDSWSELTDALLAAGFGRDAALLALGGGVVGDLAGFVAATYQRGIPVVQLPTTLVAMVDASVGGKTGVDTPHGKNLVGAFHQPSLVLADPAALVTLPERVYRGGLAEAVKHGVALDAEYFDWLARSADGILRRDPMVLVELVHRSVNLKAAVVSEDEHEAGRRAVLNAGHTVAHALEFATEFAIPHGEAVALGLLAETRYAEAIGCAQPQTASRIHHLLDALGLPTRLADLPDPARVVEAMRLDKKNRAGAVRLALPEAIGRMAGRQSGWTVPLDQPDALVSALGTLA